jgi:DNA-binding HxlR family transcriptional regulator
MLQNISVINPFATLIHLPDEVAHPRKSLLLLLNFIDVITYFFQYQREQVVDESTGEVCIKTHPQDIELAFKFLKNNLFRRADELSTSARGFFVWLNTFLNEAQQTQFTAMDIRKAKAIHPRTLNRYLQELKLFSYIQIAGGNKNREGFIYKLTNFGNQTDTQNKIEQALQSTLKSVWSEYNKLNTKAQSKPIEAKPEPIKTEPQKLAISEAQPINTEQQNTSVEAELTTEQQPTFFEPHYKRIRINEKEEYTLKILLELEAKEQGRQYLASDITTLSKRSQCIEARYLKTLWEQGKLNREWKNRQYYYTIVTTNSKPVSQNPQTNPEPQAQ